jgi:hypothetical protein
MQLYEIGRLSETQPALAGGRFAPFQFRGNCVVPAFGISIAADFKFLHLNTRHHGTPSQQETHWHVQTTMPLFRSVLSLRANCRIGGNWEGVTKRGLPITRMGHPDSSSQCNSQTTSSRNWPSERSTADRGGKEHESSYRCGISIYESREIFAAW